MSVPIYCAVQGGERGRDLLVEVGVLHGGGGALAVGARRYEGGRLAAVALGADELAA